MWATIPLVCRDEDNRMNRFVSSVSLRVTIWGYVKLLAVHVWKQLIKCGTGTTIVFAIADAEVNSRRVRKTHILMSVKQCICNELFAKFNVL